MSDLTEQRDTALARLSTARDVMTAIGTILRRVTPSADERAAFNAMWAWLAENGVSPPEHVAMDQAAQAWLAERGQR